MASISANTKKRGRPKTTGKGHLIGVCFLDASLADLDTWIAAQPKPKPSRPEAIRRLVEIGLFAAPQRPSSAKTKAKAAAMAGDTIDQLANASVSEQEHARRKRRLLKGPEEFRHMRGDLPKRKEP